MLHDKHAQHITEVEITYSARLFMAAVSSFPAVWALIPQPKPKATHETKPIFPSYRHYNYHCYISANENIDFCSSSLYCFFVVTSAGGSSWGQRKSENRKGILLWHSHSSPMRMDAFLSTRELCFLRCQMPQLPIHRGNTGLRFQFDSLEQMNTWQPTAPIYEILTLEGKLCFSSLQFNPCTSAWHGFLSCGCVEEPLLGDYNKKKLGMWERAARERQPAQL